MATSIPLIPPGIVGLSFGDPRRELLDRRKVVWRGWLPGVGANMVAEILAGQVLHGADEIAVRTEVDLVVPQELEKD